MDPYVYRASADIHCAMEYLDFDVRTIPTGETIKGNTGENEISITVLSGICEITAQGQTRNAGKRLSIFEGTSPHVAFLPSKCDYRVTALTQLQLSIAKTAESGSLTQVMHSEAGSAQGFSRGEGKTERVVYELTPSVVPTKLMVYEVFTPEGNWSSFPPHKHDVESDDESLLEEVYLFSFDPPEGFALIWLSDDEHLLDNAYAVRNGDLVAIPRGYHTMCVSPGFTCSTHCVMAGIKNNWKIKVKPQYKHLLNWKR